MVLFEAFLKKPTEYITNQNLVLFKDSIDYTFTFFKKLQKRQALIKEKKNIEAKENWSG